MNISTRLWCVALYGHNSRQPASPELPYPSCIPPFGHRITPALRVPIKVETTELLDLLGH
jgi:hypothetical protein